MTEKTRKPRSFAVPGHTEGPKRQKRTAKAKKARKPRAIESSAKLEMLPDEAVDEFYDVDALTPPPPPPAPRRFGWAKLAVGALMALAAMAAGLAVDSLIRDLFARNDWLGWAALGLTAIAVVAVLAIAIREIWGISRLATVDRLRRRGARAREDDDLDAARSVARGVVAVLDERPQTAHGRALLAEHGNDIMDGSDLIHLIERDLLAPLDKNARAMVMNSAKRVSLVTAVSPRALVDVGFVLFENMRLIRRIAEHYGGRPGAISSMRLVRQVLTHLAATGAIAVGDSLIQQVIGHGLAARLSARLGEGVINGLLTARIGIAAIDVCRPLEFDAEKRPGVNDFLAELVKLSPQGDEKNKKT